MAASLACQRGRPTKASNAEMELVALKGAVTRFMVYAAPSVKDLAHLSKYDQRGVEASRKVLAEMVRLLRAKDCHPAL